MIHTSIEKQMIETTDFDRKQDIQFDIVIDDITS